MAYHTLTNETGGTADDRRNEADRIIQILSENMEFTDMAPNEQRFIGDMQDGAAVSPKQLFWLRDILAKYCQ
jgi:hypothetical protein